MTTRPVATITGASRGLGRSLAVEAARSGYDVIGLGRDAEALAETASRCEAAGAAFTAHVVDLADEAAALPVLRSLPVADLAVANAGLVGSGPALEVDRAELLRLLTVNTIAAFEFLRESARAMIAAERPGRLIAITSDAAYIPIPGMGPYVASKHALAGLAKVLERELAATGVRVTVAYPGGIDTEMVNVPADLKHIVMDPDEVARTLIAALLAAGRTVRIPEIHFQALGH